MESRVKYVKYGVAAGIVVIVTILLAVFGNTWLSLLYTTILAIFPQEIKEWGSRFAPNGQVRVSFAYLFCIRDENLYLLVKDEQGRNSYHPVGGVYKYNPDKIDIAARFSGIYDGMFSLNEDTEQDLRLKISKKKLTDFTNWFLTGNDRENETNLSREFVEELIDRNILKEKNFRRLKYRYVGSATRHSQNQKLKIPQVHHFDVFELRLTTEQTRQIDALRKVVPDTNSNFVFATEEDIVRGRIHFAGNEFEIADTAKYILVSRADSLDKEFDLPKEITVSIAEAFRTRNKENRSLSSEEVQPMQNEEGMGTTAAV